MDTKPDMIDESDAIGIRRAWAENKVEELRLKEKSQ